MIKGVMLGVFVAGFIVSLIFTISGIAEALSENMITGAVIGARSLLLYSGIGLFFSFVGFAIMVLWMRRG